MDIEYYLSQINEFVLNPLILLALSVASIVFFWGIYQFIRSETGDSKREEGKKKIFWGMFGMFIMVSAYGLIYLILNTFGISTNVYPLNVPYAP